MAGAVTQPAAITMRSVSVGYEGRPVLHGLDLEVAWGDVVALLGPNGSGKSTLVRAILGLVPILAGSLELFGVPADRFTDRARIGYVPQRDSVGGGVPATVQEVVAAGRLGRRRLLGPLLRSHDRAIVAEAIATVGLTEKSGQTVTTLSGGQQRRTLIARALASQPDLLVMDEPLAGVDVANTRILAQALTALAERGTTLLLVTHDLSAVASLIRRAVILRHGQVSYDGPPGVGTIPTDSDPHGGAERPAVDDHDLGLRPGVVDETS